MFNSSTLALSLLCLNLQTITSNQTSGIIFDIPLKTPNNESLSSQQQQQQQQHRELHNLRSGVKDEFQFSDQHQNQQPQQKIPFTKDELREARKLRKERFNERREKARQLIREHQPDAGQMDRMSQEDIRKVYGNAIKVDPELEHEDNMWLRNLGSSQEYLADIGEEYGEFFLMKRWGG